MDRRPPRRRTTSSPFSCSGTPRHRPGRDQHLFIGFGCNDSLTVDTGASSRFETRGAHTQGLQENRPSRDSRNSHPANRGHGSAPTVRRTRASRFPPSRKPRVQSPTDSPDPAIWRQRRDWPSRALNCDQERPLPPAPPVIFRHPGRPLPPFPRLSGRADRIRCVSRTMYIPGECSAGSQQAGSSWSPSRAAVIVSALDKWKAAYPVYTVPTFPGVLENHTSHAYLSRSVHKVSQRCCPHSCHTFRIG